MNNILTAIKAIVENSSITVVESPQNRATQMDDALEDRQDIRSIKHATKHITIDESYQSFLWCWWS